MDIQSKSEIKVIFFKQKGIIPKLVRFLTFSKWNHVGIEVFGVFYDVRMREGVVQVNNPEYTSQHNMISFEVPIKDAYRMKYHLDDQVGKGYDFMALIALPFRKNWESENHWFCSELTASALKEGGVLSTRFPDHRVTPRDLFIMMTSSSKYNSTVN